MNDSVEEIYSREQVVLLASYQDWDLVASLAEGVPEKHELFLLFFGSAEIFSSSISNYITLNQTKALGNGFQFHPFLEPSPGIRVEVKKGWALSGENQCRLFLEKFIKITS
jgi:hypothetical protein